MKFASYTRRSLAGILLALAGSSPSFAQPATPSTPPPVQFQGQLDKVQLPAPPQGMVWNRIDAIDSAVLTPSGWLRIEGKMQNGRVFGFSDKPLNAKRQFERGLTVKAAWLDNSKGAEVEAVDELLNRMSRVLEGTPETTQLLDARTGKKSGKIISVMRVRTALPNETPEISHALMIGDPVSGLVYQFLFSAPESEWEANWKIAEKMLNNVFIQFRS
jgi:hypothetical protein